MKLVQLLTKDVLPAVVGIYIFRLLALIFLLYIAILFFTSLSVGGDLWIKLIPPIAFLISALLVSFTALQQIKNTIVDKENDLLLDDISNYDMVLFLLLKVENRLTLHCSLFNKPSIVFNRNVAEIEWMWKELHSKESIRIVGRYFEKMEYIDAAMVSIVTNYSEFIQNGAKSDSQEEITALYQSTIDEISDLYQQVKQDRKARHQSALDRASF